MGMIGMAEQIDRPRGFRVPTGPADPALSLVAGKKEHGNMGNLAAVIVHGSDAKISAAALHGKSHLEKDVQYAKSPDELPNPTRYWIVWVNARGLESGQKGFHGMIANELLIDHDAKLAYKHLGSHVNGMSYAMKGRIDLGRMTDEEKAALKRVLIEKGANMWEHASPEVKAALETFA